MEHKGGHWLVHEKCISHTAVCNCMQKGTSRAEATSNRENFKLLVLVKEFQVNLKVCLDLFYLTNTALLLSGKIKAGFWVM